MCSNPPKRPLGSLPFEIDKMSLFLQDLTDSEDEQPLASVKARLQSAHESQKRQEDIANHERRLDKVLKVNGLQRISVHEDGDCFFSSLICSGELDTDVKTLRHALGEHFKKNIAIYKPFLCDDDVDELVIDIETEGRWNTRIMDLLPYISANYFQTDISIYHSLLSYKKVEHTKLKAVGPQPRRQLVISYRASPGCEHYDAVELVSQTSFTCKNTFDIFNEWPDDLELDDETLYNEIEKLSADVEASNNITTQSAKDSPSNLSHDEQIPTDLEVTQLPDDVHVATQSTPTDLPSIVSSTEQLPTDLPSIVSSTEQLPTDLPSSDSSKDADDSVHIAMPATELPTFGESLEFTMTINRK